jgi:hypothetical protein
MPIALIADFCLSIALFIWHGWHIWGPFLDPPVHTNWSQPVFLVSVVFGILAAFLCGLGLLRPASRTVKSITSIASILYWIGFTLVWTLRLL